MPKYSRLRMFAFVLSSAWKGLLHILTWITASPPSGLCWNGTASEALSAPALVGLLSDYPKLFSSEQLLLLEMTFHFNFLIIRCMRVVHCSILISKTVLGIWQCEIKTNILFLENAVWSIWFLFLFLIGKVTETLNSQVILSRSHH